MFKSRQTTPFALSLLLAMFLAGCSATLERVGIGGGGKAGGNGGTAGSSETEPTVDGQVRLRDYYGSGYCPKIEVREGTQVIRKFVDPKEQLPETIIWQATISETARQCSEDPNGTMTLKIGVSGRVLAGPKGGPADVTVPIRIAVVKFQESVLSSELYRESVTIGPELSTVFRRVYEITVPSPGEDRDYLIYVGFDGG